MHNNTKGTEEENALAQRYYDFAVKLLKPKLEKYINVDVSKTVLKKRIAKCRKYYKILSDIQYGISKIEKGTALEFTMTGDTKPTSFNAEAIDTQAKNWISRLSTTISFLLMKQSEYDVKSSIRRDVIFCMISIAAGVITSIIISRCF